MQQKLRDLMTSEHLKSGQLAEALGINPAGISHILAGRNKPSFELLQKILRRFPQINPDWLLLDKGSMYREEPSDATEPTTQPMAAPEPERTSSAAITSLFEAEPTTPNAATPSVASVAQSLAVKSSGRIARVVIFYDDQTFESFTPNK